MVAVVVAVNPLVGVTPVPYNKAELFANVVAFDAYTIPLAVQEVWLVPPLAVANVPARVIAPLVAAAGVRPVVPPAKVVTPALAILIVPAPLVIVIPVPWVSVVLVKFVPLPISRAPLAGVEDRPVPPLATFNVPARVIVPVVLC
jgi:hypothetical protein